MTDDDSDELLLAYIQGDENAASVLYYRYCDRVMNILRPKIADYFSSRISEEDIYQSACKSFFVRARRGEFEVDGGKVFAALVMFAIKKLYKHIERERAMKRDPRKEVFIENIDQIISRSPQAEHAAWIWEEMVLFFGSLDELEKGILIGWLTNESIDIIAAKTGRKEATVRQRLCSLRGRLEHRIKGGEEKS